MSDIWAANCAIKTIRRWKWPRRFWAADFPAGCCRNVRTQHGWAYNISSGWGASYDHPGTFRISGSTQSAHTVDTLKAVREELDRIRTTEVTDEELQTAKDTTLNGFVFHFDRPSKTLNRLVQYEYYGYPRDFIFQYQKAIAAVTKADVLRVAQKYFKPEDLTYVAVGNPEDFGTPLSALNMKVEPIDLTIPEPKKETAKADPASLEKGKALLQRVQQALGRRRQTGRGERSTVSGQRRNTDSGRGDEGEANQYFSGAFVAAAGY